MGSRVGNSKGIFTPSCYLPLALWELVSHDASGIEVEKVGNSSFLATPYSLFPIPFFVNFPHFFPMRVWSRERCWLSVELFQAPQ